MNSPNFTISLLALLLKYTKKQTYIDSKNQYVYIPCIQYAQGNYPASSTWVEGMAQLKRNGEEGIQNQHYCLQTS